MVCSMERVLSLLKMDLATKAISNTDSGKAMVS